MNPRIFPIIIIKFPYPRSFPMNFQSNSEYGLKQSSQKIKLDILSQQIFAHILQAKELSEEQLMRYLLHLYGNTKEETLKRRRYDAINILQSANIIQTIKVSSHLLYKMKCDVPNSRKDVQEYKEKTKSIQERVKQKKQKLQRLRTASSNFNRLLEINEIRKEEQQKIKLPLVVATKQFENINYEPENCKDIIRMKFPSGTNYITNILVLAQIFNF